MNECHTLTQQNDESPKDKEPGMEIEEAGDILYTQKGKYYIRGITTGTHRRVRPESLHLRGAREGRRSSAYKPLSSSLS